MTCPSEAESLRSWPSPHRIDCCISDVYCGTSVVVPQCGSSSWKFPYPICHRRSLDNPPHLNTKGMVMELSEIALSPTHSSLPSQVFTECQSWMRPSTVPSKGAQRYTRVPAGAAPYPWDSLFNLPQGNYTLISKEEKQTPGIKHTLLIRPMWLTRESDK